jgi:hypothetical protein
MRINNNILAVIIVSLMMLSLWMNFTIINQAGTGLSGKSIAVVDLCINSPPIPVVDDCNPNIPALLQYSCYINTTDYFENQQITFSDNTTLFNINSSTGQIYFSPSLFQLGNYSILITANDGTGCSNAIASEIWNITIYALDDTARLHTWSDTDNTTKYKYDPIRFYANYTSLEDNSSIPGANCTLQFNTTGEYTNPYQMTYNASMELYTYMHAQGFLQGNHTFRTLCNGIDVGHSINENFTNFTITNRPPYLYANFPNITIRQATSLFGYNLNDYFKDEDLDILSFNNFIVPNMNIEISASGDVVFRPDPWFHGERTTFFRATDGFDTAMSNFFTITVQQVTADPSSGGGGGGGGSSGPPPKICIEDWECSEWGPCTPQGYQYRQCVDMNKCYTNKTMPDIVQECEYIGTCYDGIKNCHSGSCELGVDCGGPCDPCPSCFDGIQNQGETGIDCGGPCDPCRDEPRIEEPAQGIIISPEVRRTGLSILAFLAILGALAVIISLILHKQVMGKLSKLPALQFTGSIAHVSAESRAVIAIEMARSDEQATYKDKITKLSMAFQKLIRTHLKEESSMTLEQIRNRATDIGNEKLAARIVSLSKIIEEAEYKGSEEPVNLETIIDPMLSIVHTLIHSKVHDDQVKLASKASGRLKHSFIKALLDVSDSLIRNRRVYSSAILVREALIYYKQIKPSNILKEQMESTVLELNKAVQKAREEQNA